MQEIEDPELRELAEVLPNLALQSRAPATVKNTRVLSAAGRNGQLLSGK